MIGIRDFDPAHTCEPRHVADDDVQRAARSLVGCAALANPRAREIRYIGAHVDTYLMTEPEYRRLDEAAYSQELSRRISEGSLNG